MDADALFSSDDWFEFAAQAKVARRALELAARGVKPDGAADDIPGRYTRVAKAMKQVGRIGGEIAGNKTGWMELAAHLAEAEAGYAYHLLVACDLYGSVGAPEGRDEMLSRAVLAINVARSHVSALNVQLLLKAASLRDSEPEAKQQAPRKAPRKAKRRAGARRVTS